MRTLKTYTLPGLSRSGVQPRQVRALDLGSLSSPFSLCWILYSNEHRENKSGVCGAETLGFNCFTGHSTPTPSQEVTAHQRVLRSSTTNDGVLVPYPHHRGSLGWKLYQAGNPSAASSQNSISVNGLLYLFLFPFATKLF